MSMKAVTVVLLVALALGTVASATTASPLHADQLSMLQKQLRQRHPKLGVRPTANTTAAIQEVPPFEGPFMEGDIVVSGANKVYVVNGTSFELKGTLESKLDDCPDVVGLAFSPDNSVLAVVCYPNSYQQIVLLNTTGISVVNTTRLTASTVCPDGSSNCVLLQVLYMPSGDLLGIGAGINITDATIQWYSAQAAPNGTVTKAWVMAQPKPAIATTSTSLMKDGKTLVYADVAPAVMRFNLSGNSTATALASVANGQCMSVVALYDNTLLAGYLVKNGTFNGFCAYRLSAKGATLASWCTPSAYTRNVTEAVQETGSTSMSIAIDVDHKSFVVTILDLPDPSGAAVKGAPKNILRVRLSDFKAISSNAVPADLSWSSLVFAAVPASQQECDTGSCCTPSGLLAPAAAPCRASEFPCVKAGVCDGKSAACPRDNAEHGALCSLRPWGLFDPVDESTKDLSEEEARDRGYHKCGMCSFGVCVPGHAGRKGGDSSSGHGRFLRAAAAADSRSEVQDHRHAHLTYCTDKQE